MNRNVSGGVTKAGSAGYSLRPLISWIVGFVAIAIIASDIVSLARQKLFWFDEAHEVLGACARPYASIVVDGPYDQCSPAPLYYLIQKSVVGHVGMSPSILTTYRFISISAAILTLLILHLGFSRYFGLSMALLALMVLSSRPDFFQFAAENRPYMLWLLLFTAALMLASSMAHREWRNVRPVSKACLGIVLVALTLVSAAGMFQAFLFLAALTLWHDPSDPRAWVTRRVFRFQLPVALMCAAAGGYYALKACLDYYGMIWDLLATGNSQLVWDVLDLLYPLRLSSCHDRSNPCGLVSMTINVFVAAAVVILPFWWKRRMRLSEPLQFALSISLVSILQILCAVFLGILVARAHYFFVPRLFLYFLSLRAALAAAGAYFCMSLILRWPRNRFRILQAPILQWIVLAGILSVAVITYIGSKYVSAEGVREKVEFVDNKCPPVRSAVAIVDTKAPAFVTVNETYEHEEHKLNFIYGFSQHLDACGWTPAPAPVVYVVPEYVSGRIFGYEIRETIDAGSPIIGFFDQPVLPRAQ
jgi:hypothetical protein